MNDEIEDLLNTVTPRGSPAELRVLILDRVAQTLAEDSPAVASPPPARRMSWESRLAWAVAVLLLVGVGLNLAAMHIGAMRLAVYDPQPETLTPNELVIELARGGSDFSKGRRLVACWAATPAMKEETLRRYHDLLRQCVTLAQEPLDAFKTEAQAKSTEMDVHRSRKPRDDHSGCQRPVRLDHQFTA